MKLNRLSKLTWENSSYEYEITISIFSGEATLEKIKSIISKTKEGKCWEAEKNYYTCCQIEQEVKNILNGSGGIFDLETFEDGEVAKGT